MKFNYDGNSGNCAPDRARSAAPPRDVDFPDLGVFLIALGPVFGFLSPKDSQTVLESLGLAAILLAGLFITIVTCIYLIPVEIERRTI